MTTNAKRTDPVVILYSTSLSTWEAWQTGRPLASASDPHLLVAQYPDALPVSDEQRRLAAGAGA